MSRTFTAISADAFQHLQFEAGVVLSSFNPASPAIADNSIVCATTGGIKVSHITNYQDMGADVDNCPENTKELKRKKDSTCKMSFTALTVTPAMIRMGIGAADISGNKIIPSAELKSAHFQDIWWVGDMSDGGCAAVCLKNGLSTGGLTIEATKNEKGKITLELTGHYSLSNKDVDPMEFYVIAGTTSTTSGT